MQNNTFPQLFFIIFVFNIYNTRAHARSAEFQNSAALSIRICNPFKKKLPCAQERRILQSHSMNSSIYEIAVFSLFLPNRHLFRDREKTSCLVRYYAITLLHFVVWRNIISQSLYILYY